MPSIFAFPVKGGGGKRPPLIASASGSVDQMKCFTPAAFAARTAFAACRRSSVPGCQKLVTRKTPCAPSRAARIASGRSRSASTTSSASARCFAGSRVRARTLNTPRSCRARTTAPPCCPVAPKTAMVLRVFDDMISPSVSDLCRGRWSETCTSDRRSCRLEQLQPVDFNLRSGEAGDFHRQADVQALGVGESDVLDAEEPEEHAHIRRLRVFRRARVQAAARGEDIRLFSPEQADRAALGVTEGHAGARDMVEVGL